LRDLVLLLEIIERGGTSVMELMRGGRPQEPWTLYPGDYGIFDTKSGCQFYYHAHAGAEHEAGHFHTARFFPDRTVHLVAISMAETGWPRALFTVNSWVVGDVYEPPENLKGYAREFSLGPKRGPALLVRFINLMFCAFIDEIERLQDEKERTLGDYRVASPGKDPLQDRSLEVLSRVEIDVRAALQRSVAWQGAPGIFA
jgi:hypothetical protein